MVGCKHHGTTTTLGCRYCELFATDNRYRIRWGGEPIEGLKRKRRRKVSPQVLAEARARKRVELPPCPELGRPLRDDELVARGLDPAACGCSRKIRACGLHDVCTTGAPREGMACCMTCPDHPSRSGV